MWGTEIRSGDSCPINDVPCRLKGGEQPGERAASIIAEKPGGIFRHKESWAESRNNSETFAPHPSVIVATLPLASETDRLAWHTGADQIDFPIASSVRGEGLDLSPSRDVRPVFLQHRCRIGVPLDLPAALHARPLKPEVEATDPSE
jgi:hypothetical protein